MYTISKHYNLKWQVRGLNHIQVSTCKTVINTKTNRVLKERVNGGSYGYWIGGKFILTSKMNGYLEKITIFDIPF